MSLRQTLKSCTIVRLLFLAVAFFCPVDISRAQQANRRQPNIVIVLADDMGYGDPGCYNSASKCPTPSIDRLAAEGMRFTDAHAAGAWCTPSRYGLLTGRYAFRTSLAWQQQPVIAEDVATIADTLRKAGYQTAMVGKWHLGFVGGTQVDYASDLRGGPCDRGFDSWLGLPASLDIPDYYWVRDRRVTRPPTIPLEGSTSEGWSPVQAKFWRGGLRGEDFLMEKVLDELAAEAVRQVNSLSKQDSPFFLYVPLTSPHTPWLPGEAYRDANEAGLYSQFVKHTDAVLGRILQSIDGNQITGDTVVIFTSDNGPVWYQADVRRFGHDAMGGWRGMKGDVWEAGHRVPFIVRWPDKVAAGAVRDQLISFVDVFATLSEIAGAEPASSAVDSMSFAGVWLGQRNLSVRSELVSFQDPIAIRSGNWKLINRRGSAGFLSHEPRGRSSFLQRDELNPDASTASDGPEGQLYDLASDPAETRNLWKDRPDLVERLRQRLSVLRD